MIRFAEKEDIPRITEIYNQAVKAGNANADTEEHSVQQREAWFEEHSGELYPIYVLVEEGLVIGWGALSPWRKGRGGLRDTAEITYYLDYNHHKKGQGKKLLAHIISDCPRLGINNLLAILLDINTPSIRLLELHGFNKWGHLPDVAKLKSFSCGQVIYGKKL